VRERERGRERGREIERERERERGGESNLEMKIDRKRDVYRAKRGREIAQSERVNNQTFKLPSLLPTEVQIASILVFQTDSGGGQRLVSYCACNVP
jgi:hypothetical protein